MNRLAHVILVLAVVWGSVLPALGGMRGLALCFSSGGHAAIEATHADPSCASLCGDDAPATTDDPSGLATPHDCFDVTLPSLDIRVDRVQPERPTVPSPTSAPALPDFPAVDALWTADPGGRLSFDGPMARGPSPGLRELRTIVLRI